MAQRAQSRCFLGTSSNLFPSRPSVPTPRWRPTLIHPVYGLGNNLFAAGTAGGVTPVGCVVAVLPREARVI